MNGLEAILNRIMTDAEDRVRDIQEQADARCIELLAAADQEAEKIKQASRQKAEEQAKVELRRAESLSALESRKLMLSSRQTLIDEVIDQAAVRLAEMPASDKKTLYRRLLLEHAKGSETVVFAQGDALIAGPVVADINGEKGWQLAIDSEPGRFSGGLILRQNLIETNLTVDLLIRSLRPELVSLAAKALFGH